MSEYHERNPLSQQSQPPQVSHLSQQATGVIDPMTRYQASIIKENNDFDPNEDGYGDDDDDFHEESPKISDEQVASPVRSTSRERKKKIPQKLNYNGRKPKNNPFKATRASHQQQQQQQYDDQDESNYNENDDEDEMDESYSLTAASNTYHTSKTNMSKTKSSNLNSKLESGGNQYAMNSNNSLNTIGGGAKSNMHKGNSNFNFKNELKANSHLPKLVKKTNNLNLAGHAFGYEVDPIADKVDMWGHLLIGISYFFLIFSFPFSLCACVKVSTYAI